MIYTHAVTAVITAVIVSIGTWVVQSWLYDGIIAKTEAKHFDEIRQAENNARMIETKWQKDAAQSREEKNREIRNIRSTYIAAINSLRDRPDRPVSEMSADTNNGNVAEGCNGQTLYRPDAEFLIGEAARADEIRLSLLQCYDQYNSLIQDKTKNENSSLRN